MSLFILVDIVRFDSFSYTLQEDLSSHYIIEDHDCQIVSSVVSCDQDTQYLFLTYMDQIDFYIIDQDTIDYDNYSSQFAVIFNQDEVALSSLGTVITSPISDLPESFHNLDFSLLNTDSESFIEDFNQALEDYVLSTKSTWGTIASILIVILNAFLAFMIALLTAFFMKSRYKQFTFGQVLKMSVYVSSSTFMILTFMNMLGMELLFLLLIFMINSRQLSRLHMGIAQSLQK
jgi:hypothetical protein